MRKGRLHVPRNEIQHELMVVTWRNVASTDERLCDRKLLILGAHGLLATDSRVPSPEAALLLKPLRTSGRHHRAKVSLHFLSMSQCRMCCTLRVTMIGVYSSFRTNALLGTHRSAGPRMHRQLIVVQPGHILYAHAAG